ncbi:thiamine-phosphate kinase [Phormidesmis priestleyi ULC007]|uniref:Thiamine-monophosphate kinase n=1 Tax=Phormidesmis priestleyi ULC007 TaxID=1920490 RepID=A0A2T1DGU7_9CYAN|nr:thiamine-phosphate kinase [Phormidesmis priestleyi]PSB19729.1 thiamine-phosphate kinase [Phormidesmis priestleyi ULC007]PZO53613.1 MAG: thiamine-phosphate kinase [Phormidesmis priestleyi]
MSDSLTVQNLGEQGLLKRVQSFCPSTVVGDDAAVLPTESGMLLVVTSDVLVDRVHFSNQTTPPESVGWRSAAANLSDLAAMGASPLGITVGLGLPGEVLVSWVEDLYRGITGCLQKYGTVIVGGDLCRSPVITVAITAFGQVDPTRVIRRATAQPGDAILVTGFHGSSRAGLELLLHPELGQELSQDDRISLIQAHQYPNPRLDILPSLPETRISGMDSSDGLADAIVQICRASGVGARLDRQKIPIHPALKRWASSEKAMKWALYGGEDFELVLCLQRSAAQKLVERLGGAAAIVGTITSDSDIRVIDFTQETPDEILTLEQGFQHFSSD